MYRKLEYESDFQISLPTMHYEGLEQLASRPA